MTLSLILLAAIAGVGALLWLMEQRTLRRQQDAPEPEPAKDCLLYTSPSPRDRG